MRMKASAYILLIAATLPLLLYLSAFQGFSEIARSTLTSWSSFTPAQQGASLAIIGALLYPLVLGVSVLVSAARFKKQMPRQGLGVSCVPLAYLALLVAFFVLWDRVYPA